MESSQQLNIFKNANASGKKILKDNPFFRDFTGLMRNDEFKKFYRNYFKNWSDIQTMIFYMKLYTTIKDAYYGQYNENITDELMTFTLHKIITTTEMRKMAMELFKNFKGESLYIINPQNLITFTELIDFDSCKTNLLIQNTSFNNSQLRLTSIDAISSTNSSKDEYPIKNMKWELDEDVSNCRNCNDEFDILNRRHHCRYCGKIFCNKCSDNKIQLPPEFNKIKPQRVCIGCDNILKCLKFEY